MSKVAVVTHARKSFGGGLPELRNVLAREEGPGQPVVESFHPFRD